MGHTTCVRARQTSNDHLLDSALSAGARHVQAPVPRTVGVGPCWHGLTDVTLAPIGTST